MILEDIEAHKRLTFFLNQLFYRDNIGLKSNHIKTLYECQHYEDINFHEKKYDLKGRHFCVVIFLKIIESDIMMYAT